MRKIAILAVAFAVLGVVASVQLTSADSNQTVAKKETKPAAVTLAEKKKAILTTAPVAVAPVMVTIHEGDTLSAVAEAHNTTYVRIFNANESIADPNVITPGQELRIPAADEQLADRALPVPAPAPVAAVAAPAAVAATPSPRAAAPVSYPAVSGNDAKAFIYARESGNNPNATNSNGCYGLGQDCNGRVRSLCGADYACQDQFFTNYAMSRYGSWEGALAFWQTHQWW